MLRIIADKKQFVFPIKTERGSAGGRTGDTDPPLVGQVLRIKKSVQICLIRVISVP
jgi:hypothetical protein